MEAPFNVIKDLLTALFSDNREVFLETVPYDAVIEVDGDVFSGKSFAEEFSEAGFVGYTIDYLNIPESNDESFQANFCTTVTEIQNELKLSNRKYFVLCKAKAAEEKWLITEAKMLSME